MKRTWLAACYAILALGLPGCASDSQADASGKTIVITPSKAAAESADQQLVLRGLKAPADAAGVRVFLNPDAKEKLSPETRSYLGSIFFSHRKIGENKGQDFVLTLSKPVTGNVRVVLYPISANGGLVNAKLDLQNAAIRPVNNSAYR